MNDEYVTVHKKSLEDHIAYAYRKVINPKFSASETAVQDVANFIKAAPQRPEQENWLTDAQADALTSAYNAGKRNGLQEIQEVLRKLIDVSVSHHDLTDFPQFAVPKATYVESTADVWNKISGSHRAPQTILVKAKSDSLAEPSQQTCTYVEASPDPTLHLHDKMMFVGKCNDTLLRQQQANSEPSQRSYDEAIDVNQVLKPNGLANPSKYGIPKEEQKLL
jgi:hypothetical protein